jgi:hypothetical protein
MSKVVDIDANKPHMVSEVLCVHCVHRWISVRPVETLLKDLKCPNCQKQGGVIETGQLLDVGGDT